MCAAARNLWKGLFFVNITSRSRQNTIKRRVRNEDMKPKDLEKLKEKFKQKLKKNKIKKEDEGEADLESDYPVHEKS